MPQAAALPIQHPDRTDGLQRALQAEDDLPAVYSAGEWATGKNYGAILLLDGEADDVTAWRVLLKSPRFSPMVQALGMKYDAQRASWRVPTLREVGLLCGFAPEADRRKLRAKCPQIDVLEEPIAAPCVHYIKSRDLFIFVGGFSHRGWAKNTGWAFSENGSLWYTDSALKAAGLYKLATPQARAKIDEELSGLKLLAAVKKGLTFGRPWMTYDPRKDRLVVHGEEDLRSSLEPYGFRARMSLTARNAFSGRFTTRNLRAACDLAQLADPALATGLAAIASKLQFLDIGSIDISSLLGQIVSTDSSANKKKAEADRTLKIELRYVKKQKRFFTTRVEAANENAWTLAKDAVWMTTDPVAASRYRKWGDDETEIAIQTLIAEEYAAAAAARIPAPVPAPLKGQSYTPDQIVGINFATTRPWSVLADDMGYGKTMQAVGVIDVLRPRYVLILTLASVTPAFARAVTDWVSYQPTVNLFTNLAKTPVQPGVTVASYESILNNPGLLDYPWDYAVFDEFHKLKNQTAKRARAVIERLGYKLSGGLFLSGTPLTRRPQDLFTPLHLSLPQAFDDYGRFTKVFGLGDLDSDNEERRERRKTLGRIIMGSIMLRRLKKGLPPKRRQPVELDAMDPSLVDLLKEENLIFDSYKNTENKVERKKIMTKLNALRRRTASFKIPYAVEWVITKYEQGEPVLVFAHHQEIIDQLADVISAFGPKVAKLHGGANTPRKRQKLIDQFQAGQIDVIVAGIQAAGTGLTMTRAAEVLFVELDYDPFALLQAEDRSHRHGQTRPVNVWYMVIKGSIDAYICSIVDTKLRIANEIYGDEDKIYSAVGSDLAMAAAA
jgi:SNF2-related domain